MQNLKVTCLSVIAINIIDYLKNKYMESNKMINEWENEPDYLRFTEDTTGWECVIKRTKALGILCGYVVIPKDSALYNKHYCDELFDNIKVHGGLTYSEYEERGDEYLIGFDCAHCDDLAPYKQDLYQGTYRNIGYVEYECLRLARQLYELSIKIEE